MECDIFLNSDNKKIMSYLSENGLDNYEDSFLFFLREGYKIDKKLLKQILRFVRLDNYEDFIHVIDNVFLDFGISISSDSLINNNSFLAAPASSYLRVKKYRSRAKQKGLKNLSFFVSPEDYKKLCDLKRLKSMTNAQILSFLLSQVK